MNLYEKENKKLKEQKAEILKETRSKADQLLSNINKQFENTIKNIKETNARKEIIKTEKKKIDQIKSEMKEIYAEPLQNQESNWVFRISDYVQIKDSLTSGEIVEIEETKGNVTIDTGSLRIKAKIKNLIPARKPLKSKLNNISTHITSIESSSLDIRGQRPDEIEYDVIKFIDEAHLAGLKEVEIIHGKGTGVLRQSVHQILKEHVLVKSFELASIELGGAGATNIKLK